MWIHKKKYLQLGNSKKWHVIKDDTPEELSPFFYIIQLKKENNLSNVATVLYSLNNEYRLSTFRVARLHNS